MRRRDTPLVSLTGMVLNNAEAPAHQLAMKRKPAWLRAKLPGGDEYNKLRKRLAESNLHTVCQEASCPNMGECWARGVATIMILGDTCTRSCGFCNIKTGKPLPADTDEPRRVAESLAQMGLNHVVVTSVDRDDLPDGGAQIWADTITEARKACPDMSIEVLIPDFQGDPEALRVVIDARPDILNHNLETVRRMYPAVRPQAKFDRSLELLRICRKEGLVTKTGIMVGIGEKDEEVLDLIDDVIESANTHILTIGQYMQPTRNHLPIDRWVEPETFDMFKREALARGFEVVESGPLVRSSYHADEQAIQLKPGAPASDSPLSRLIREARAAN